MAYDPEKHHRRSIRLPDYDYRQPGGYFVTVCVQDGACLFGEVAEGRVHLNACGHVARTCWKEIPDHFPHVQLDAFVIMPNHVHGIIGILGDGTTGGGDACVAPTHG